MPEWLLYLPEVLPSLNETHRQHWGRKKKDRARWGKIIAVEKVRAQIPSATGKRRLTIERHGRRKLDADNLAGGCKGFIDELRAFRLLVDDNPANMELVTVNVPLGKGQQPHTVIRLEDL